MRNTKKNKDNTQSIVHEKVSFSDVQYYRDSSVLSADSKTIFTFFKMINTVLIIQNQPTKQQSKVLKININDFLCRSL